MRWPWSKKSTEHPLDHDSMADHLDELSEKELYGHYPQDAEDDEPAFYDGSN